MLPSVVLQSLHDAAPEGGAGLGWVLQRLDRQSFGLILLLLAIVAAVPGICSFAGILIVICAAQMVIGRPTPIFPAWIADRLLPDRQLRRFVPRAVVVLRFAEHAVHPRWGKPGRATSHFVGGVILLLSLRLLLVPIPFSNLLPALIMAAISLAYLEEDGLVLALGVAAGLTMLGLEAAMIADAVRHSFGS